MKNSENKYKRPVLFNAGGQRGFSLLSMVLSLLIICVLIAFYVTIIGRRMGVATGKGKNATVADTKSMSADTACGQAIGNISRMAEIFRASGGGYPASIDELAGQNPGLAQLLADTSLWVENGSPTLESSDTGITITGYCTSGNQYTYNSDGGGITSAPF